MKRLLLATTVLAALFASGVGASQSDAKFTLWEGDPAPRLEGLGLDGKPVNVDYSKFQTPTVVYVITPGGEFVVRNEALFGALVRQAGARFHIVVLSTQNDGRLEPYIRRVRSGWGNRPVQVVDDSAHALYEALRLGGYPQTLVISTAGRVVKNFGGAYIELPATPMNPRGQTRATPAAIEAFFGIKLPPTTPLPRPLRW